MKLHKLLKSGELKSLNCLIKEALIEKEEHISTVLNLGDGLAAVLFYQNASDENRKAIDKLFLYLGFRNFATLVDNYLEYVREHDECCEEYSKIIALAHKTRAED